MMILRLFPNFVSYLIIITVITGFQTHALAQSKGKNSKTPTLLKATASPSLKLLARRQYTWLKQALSETLKGQAKLDFATMSTQVKNNIQWHNAQGINIYNEAFKRSYSFVKNLDLKGMPDSIMLIAYMESQWEGKKGRKAGDYGYWQLLPEILREIQQLSYTPQALRQGNINTIRADATLSTQAAQIHLHRYYFYFAKVAQHTENEAWLLTVVSFNWGVGNVKRLLLELEAEGIKANFSNFYHALYQRHQRNPNDRSLQAAVEYLPSLWNIALLLKKTH